VVLTADELTYDAELGLILASGNVEIWQNDNILHADTLTYNERTRTVTAAGEVSLLDPNGNVLFANYMELSDDLREGVIDDVKLLLSDRSRAVAASGRRTGGNRTELNNVVYSPCNLCAKDPTRPPLWQLKAVKVVHDQSEQIIEYEDVWLEIYGVPVAYSPYFSHPDPFVKRKTGFITPKVIVSDKLGFGVRVPYYWTLSPDKDITFRPLVTTKQGVVLDAEYRQRIVDGRFRMRGSATIADRIEESGGVKKVDENIFRGHLDGEGRFDIDEHWRAGFDVDIASDKSYLRTYDLSDERFLTTRLFAEGFHSRNYASLQGIGFQGLRDVDDNDEAPIIAPWLQYDFSGEPGAYGGYYTFDIDALSLNRLDGRESRRLALSAGWTLPYTAPAGDIYTLSASLRGDLYFYDDVDPDSDDANPAPGLGESGTKARLHPQVAFEWRYPFVRDHGTSQEVIEPIAGFVVSPSGGNSGKFPNEDSQEVEFDDTNLFSANRYSGLDRIDSGQRINYGLKWSLIGDGGGHTSVFLGQSYQLNDENKFAKDTGLEDNLTDVVGRVEVSPNEYLDLLYRFRFDIESGEVDRNEINLRAGGKALSADMSYFYLRGDAGSGAEFGNRHEVAGRISSQITDNWSAYTAARFDIEEDRMLSYGGGLAYEDECFEIRSSLTRRDFRDDELRPDTRFEIEIAFRNLGGIETGF
jgi:LPS-assembly protein